MLSKQHANRNGKAVPKQTPFQSKTRNINSPDVQTHPGTIIQRALFSPGTLNVSDVLQLQRTIGNRAVGRFLTQPGRRRPANSGDGRKGDDLKLKNTNHLEGVLQRTIGDGHDLLSRNFSGGITTNIISRWQSTASSAPWPPEA